jgi:adenylate cyclase
MDQKPIGDGDTARQGVASSTPLVDRVAGWLIAQALGDAEVETIIRGGCERLLAAGIPICRANLSFSVLHPLYRALGYTWRRGQGLEVSGYRHLPEGVPWDRFRQSPFYYLRRHGLDHFRRRLEEGGEDEFPILTDLRREGATDYLAFHIGFEPTGREGVMGSWACDRKGGFTADDIQALLRIQERLAVACKMAIRAAVARRVLATYLGEDAGARVLTGQIKRGDGETTRAAIVWGDLRGSTAMAERLGREAYIETLNTFFDAAAGAVADAGGEIVSFVGDGFLAMFPCGRNRRESAEACRRALAGAHEAVRRIDEVNREREAAGLEPLRFGLGLHIGNVMFGNVGMPDRLTFSAFGAAVNEAVRLEGLTKSFGTPIVASADFVDYAGGAWEALGEAELRGVDRRLTVHRPGEGAPAEYPIERRDRRLGLSDAEAIVLLHRDGTY